MLRDEWEDGMEGLLLLVFIRVGADLKDIQVFCSVDVGRYFRGVWAEFMDVDEVCEDTDER